MSMCILMVTTSHEQLGATGARTGVWAEELTTPWYAFRDAGIEIDLASVRGGAVPLDPRSEGTGGGDAPDSVARMASDPGLQRALAETLPLAQINVAQYDAVFFPGGHGTMWDLPGNARVRDVIESADRLGRIIATVCHGAAALVDATGTHGRPLIEGHRICAFTDAEEAAVGLTQVVPFSLEQRLRDCGALFESGEPWSPHVVEDRGFITGQNPQSSALVAERVLAALKPRH